MKATRCILFLMFFFIFQAVFGQEEIGTYKCDYTRDSSYITILISNSEMGPPDNFFGIGYEDLEKFRRNGTGTSIPDCLSAEEFISLAREYLLERKSYEMLAFYSFEIIQLELDDYRNPEWKPFYYFQVTFKTDLMGGNVIVPMLMDGRIILGLDEF